MKEIAALLIVIFSIASCAESKEPEKIINMYYFNAGDDVPVDIVLPGSYGFSWIKWDIDVYVEQHEDEVFIYPMRSLPKEQVWPVIEKVDYDYVCSGGYNSKRKLHHGDYWTAYTETCGEAVVNYATTTYMLNPKYKNHHQYIFSNELFGNLKGEYIRLED